MATILGDVQYTQVMGHKSQPLWDLNLGRNLTKSLLGWLQPPCFMTHDGSMVLYGVPWIPSILTPNVSIYTSTMDPSWVIVFDPPTFHQKPWLSDWLVHHPALRNRDRPVPWSRPWPENWSFHSKAMKLEAAGPQGMNAQKWRSSWEKS